MAFRPMNIRVLCDGLGFTEGPTITEDGAIACVSIDQGRLYRLDAHGLSILAQLGGGPNGATSDAEDVLYVSQNGGNWMRNPNPGRTEPGMTGGVQSVTPSGEVGWVSRDPLAPNDICFGPDGFLYVTDPTRDRKYNDGRLWRCDRSTGETEILATVSWFCNGIGFGVDNALWVASSGDGKMVRYAVSAAGLQGGEAVFQLEDRYPDGFTFDTHGNLIIGALSRTQDPGEVQVWTPEGRLLDRVRIGDSRHYTNTVLDGSGRLVVTDSDGGRVLCVDDWPATGLALYPRRHGLLQAPSISAAVLATSSELGQNTPTAPLSAP
jgi:gluconolactonase